MIRLARCRTCVVNASLATSLVGLLFITRLGAAESTTAAPTNDHLVPVVEYLGNAPLYRKLWEQKLLVTPGDVARFVQLPGSAGVEIAVSVHRDTQKSGGLPGGYWVTMTQPSVPLSQCYPSVGNEKPIDSRIVHIRRCDAPLPASTAFVIQRAWLKTLKDSRPLPNSERWMSVDSTTEIFSAKSPDGKIMEAQAPPIPLNSRKKVNALIRIGFWLADYCELHASDRPRLARKIETAASRLAD